jgi:HK97 family phage portal protein
MTAPYRVARPTVAARVRSNVATFWNRLTRARATTISTVGWSVVRGSQPTEFQQTGAEVRKLGWERHPVVNACARAVVDLIQSVPLEVYRERADGTAQVITGKSDALALLRAPRVGLSGQRLIARTANAFFLYGNAFWVLERNGKRGMPKGIRVIPPENVMYAWLNASDDTIASYDWRDLQGQTHSHEPVENVVHFRDLDAGDGLFGYPRLAAALTDISADSEASQYVRQIVTNHGVPGMVVMAEGAPLLSDLEAAEQRFAEKYTRRGMRGMTSFMAGVKELKEVGFNLQQLEFPDLRKVAREDICAAANVDPRIISISTATSDGGLSGVQYREARHRLIQQTVYPIMRSIEDELNYWFMPEFGEPKVRFSEEYIAAITEDVTATSARVVAEVTAKIRTVEEAREAVGLDGEMDPTHTLPGGLTVADNSANATAMSAALVQAAQAPPEPAAPETRASFLIGGPPRVRAYSEHAADRLEPEYESTALTLFDREKEDWLRVFAALAVTSALLTDAALATLLRQAGAVYAENGVYSRAWLERYADLVGRAVRAGGQDLAEAAGLDFTLANPKVRGLVYRRAGDLVQNVTTTTRDAIRAALITARAANLTIPQTAQIIADTTFGAITKARARTIARTETVGALVAGAYTAAIQTGVMRSKTWITQGDHRVRDTHVALNGQTVDIGQAFPNGLRYPHDPLGSAAECINCRCSLTYSDLEARAG